MNSVFFNNEFRHWKVLCILVLSTGSILIKFVIIGKCSNELTALLALYTLLCEYITLIMNNHNYYNSIYKPNLHSHKKQEFDKYNEPNDILISEIAEI